MKRRSARTKLVARVLGDAGVSLPESGRILPRATEELAPLAAAQRRLWILHRVDPESAGANRPLGLSLNGPLDQAVLARTLTELVRRHEALRTTFPDVGGEPVQVVETAAELPLRVLDLLHLPSAERMAEARRIAGEEARRPFDLIRGPVLRAVLLRLGRDEHLLLLLMHHIVFDGWSAGVLVGELAALYRAFAAGHDSPLPEPPIQPADFALWERAQLADGRMEDHLRFWRERLTPLPPPLTLSDDCPRPSALSSGAAEVRFGLPPVVSARLMEWSREQRVTPFMTLLAAFQALLARYAGQDEFLLGTPVAGRTRAETEGLVGCFMNLMVLRADLTGSPTFRELTQRTRAQVLASFAHQALPFERLVEELRPKRQPGRWPLIDVLFHLRNLPRAVADPAAPLKIEPFPMRGGTVDGPSLSLEVEDGPDGFAGTLAYDADRFRAETMQRLAKNFVTLLTTALTQPDRPAALLPLVAQAELRELPAERSAVADGLPPHRHVHQLIEAQAVRTPDAVAVAFDGQRLTYAELNARANRLAHHLIALGVGPEVVVASGVPRSVGIVVGLLGILKAGGVYLPLDPASPAERLAFMLRDSGVSVLLTDTQVDTAPPEHHVHRVFLDNSAGFHRHPITNPAPRVTADNLAYVIYTSGSTGRPKGVGVSHRALAEHCQAVGRRYGLSPADRVLQFSAASFDASLEQIIPTLLSGAALVLRGLEVWTPQEFGRAMLAHGITVADLPTAYWDQLVRAWDGAAELAPAGGALRLVLVGGEAMRGESLRQWRRTPLGRCRLLNAYGPTEATITATIYEVPADSETPALEPAVGTVPLGRPLAGRTAYVLDQDLQPLPAGEAGQLYLGGVGLARGYHGRPKLTAERFIPDPFGPTPGARLYRTGDRARWRSDGELDFLGRSDRQVKLRGVRVEPGEIEATLCRHPDVREAVVVAWEDTPGDSRLHAYLVAPSRVGSGAGSGSRGSDLAWEVRGYLLSSLPQHAIPASFVVLDALPMTANGKLDRSALPAPERGRPELENAYTAPRTPVEHTIAGIWADALKLDHIGVHDNFFEVGGHSLLATVIATRLRETLGVELPLRALFDSPTVGGLAAAIETAKGAAARRARIRPAGRRNRAPMSFAQQRLWLAEQLEPGSAAYSVPSAVKLTGTLDVEALEAALGEIIARHEVLRTTYGYVRDRPVQLIHSAGDFTLPVLDLTGIPEHAVEAEARRLLNGDAATPFDLSTGPLIRARLLELSSEEHVLAINLHHIVTDGWSMGVFFGELRQLYAAFEAGRPSPLAALPIQYSDYALWQRRDLRGAELAGMLDYWTRELAGAPVLQLPLDRPRRVGQSAMSRRYTTHLGPRDVTPILALMEAERVSVFMVLLAAFQTLLHRDTGSDDIVVGTTVANRPAETEGLIGLLVNQIALRVDCAGDPSFRELLRRVREVALAGYAHQGVPFEKVVAAVRPKREVGVTPLFQVLFGMDTFPSNRGAMGSVILTDWPVDTGTSKSDLAVFARHTGPELTLHWRYRTTLFDGTTIERMAGRYQRLLADAAARPDARISELEFLSGTKRSGHTKPSFRLDARHPVEQRSASSPPVPFRSLQQAFEEHAARTPDSPAVVCGDGTLSYAELNALANRVAHRLRRLGAGRDTPVGLCTDRSTAMVIGLLGIMKSGAAYVPLNPEYPSHRLAQQLAQVEAPIVVSQESLLSLLPRFAGTLLCLDRDAEHLDEESASNPDVPVEPTDLAYVIFTSGSTGVPKGVAVAHASLANYAGFVCEKLELADSPPLHFATVTTLSADLGNTSLFPSLASGGCLHVLDYDVVVDAERFAEYAARHPIDVLKIVPSHFDALLAAGSSALPRRVLILGGDALPWALIARVRALGAGCRIINHYGPTETTVGCLTFEVDSDSAAAEAATVPIGRPIANARVYVLDKRMQPTPIGVAGELYVAGLGLARGYVNQPAPTADRFVPDPFSRDGGGRMYRTGDQARYLAGGDIEFLGRTDHQLKIHGFRIEPGEIEAALTSHPAVRQAVAIAREDAPGDRRLVAYLAGDALPSTADLRSFLAARLPNYVVPTTLVTLASLPLTRNGKIDRAALPAPDRSSAAPERDVLAARTPIEDAVAAIWAELLKVERVGIREDFFELGGHSVLVMQVISRVRRVFQIELPLQALFETPTVEGLSLRVAECLGSTGARAAIPARMAGGPVPLSFAQQRLWFLGQLEPDSTAYNVSRAMRLQGDLSLPALRASLTEIVRRHAVLRTTFASVDGEPMQWIQPAAEVECPMTDLSPLPAERREAEALARVAAEARRPFDPAVEGCFRAQLLRLGPAEHVLLLNLHHIVSDGWSRGVLYRELSALYGAFAQGRPSPLRPLPIQYADYAVWQRRWLDEAESQRQLAYWTERLRDAPPLTELVLDHPRPQQQGHRGARETLTLAPGLAAGLRTLGAREHVTLFMILLAALKTVLHRYSGQQDLVVGAPIAGRSRLELEGLIGFFIGTLALRTDLSGNPSFRTLLARVRETALGAYAHPDVPFERLIEALDPERSLSHTPLVQVVLNMLNLPEAALDLSGVTTQEIRPGGTDSKFDLTLYAREHPGGITLHAAYDPDLFHGSTIARLLGHLQTLLEGVVADPDRRLWQLPLLTDAERKRPGRGEGCRPATAGSEAGSFGIEQSLGQRFEAQVRSAPHRLAVRTLAHAWTYEELNRAANRTAHALLRARGSGPEPIALLLDHDAPMIATVLGVLKAGKSYVPLDPSHPVARLRHVLQDTQPGALVTNSANRRLARALSTGRLPLLDIDELEGLEDDLDIAVSPEAPAYILYTSGSTGCPLGAVQNHRNILHFVRAYTNNLRIDRDDRLTLVSTFGVDAAVQDIFAALLNGAAVYPVDLKQVSLAELAQWMIEQEITIYHSTPTVYRYLVAELTSEAFPALRRVVLGGEAVYRKDVEAYRRHFAPTCLLVNGYGLTESTVTTQCVIDHDTALIRDAAPIGYPVQDTEVLLLDETGGPTELYGEIAIRGPHLALGYRNAPELSARRFLPDLTDGSKRIYRTGDMGRLLADGSLQFAGRKDTQVKLRGYRIELEEIGATAARQPGVRHCVAVLRGGEPEARIVAYVVLEDGRTASPAELRRLFEASLPDYMVPSVVVVLDRLPLTATGKLDRLALTLRELAPGPEATDGVPRSALEQSIASIWAEVLKVETLGVHDDFFALGGHSLLATQVVSRMRAALGLELPLRALFEARNVAALAAIVSKEPLTQRPLEPR